MGYERAAWIGNFALAAVAIVLAWVPVRGDLGKWGSIGIAVAVVLAAIALYPRRRPDGSVTRLVDNFSATVRGDNNRVQIARDNARQTMEGFKPPSGGARQ